MIKGKITPSNSLYIEDLDETWSFEEIDKLDNQGFHSITGFLIEKELEKLLGYLEQTNQEIRSMKISRILC